MPMTGPEQQRLVDTGYRHGLEHAVKELLDYKPADDDPGLPSWLHAYNAIARMADIARCPDCDFGGYRRRSGSDLVIAAYQHYPDRRYPEKAALHVAARRAPLIVLAGLR